MKLVKMQKDEIEWNVRKRSVGNHGSIYYSGQYRAESAEIIIVYDRGTRVCTSNVLYCPFSGWPRQ